MASVLGDAELAHPRVSGENVQFLESRAFDVGSSPRERGKLRPGVAIGPPVRLIPA